MKREVCQCCGRPFARKRAIVSDGAFANSAAVDVDAMSDAELREYRKLTAPGIDVDFMLSGDRLSPSLRAQFIALRYDAEPDGRLKRGISRRDFYRQYGRLRDAWHAESNARERAERLAAGWIVVADRCVNPWLEQGEAIALARGVDVDGAADVAA